MINWTPGLTLDEIEKQVILRALEHYRGNKTRTAEALGVAVRTIDYKLERYNKEDGNGKSTQENETDSESTSAGIQVEPTVKVGKEQPVSMRKQGKV